jgi:hypothetical protein
MAASSETTAGAAEVRVAADLPSPGDAVSQVSVSPKKRKRTGRIDLDDRIAEAKHRETVARAAVKAARNTARNEKKRRARLVKKAAALSCDDLERIAKLKRSGLWDPALPGGGASAPAAVDEAASTTTPSPSTSAAASSGTASTGVATAPADGEDCAMPSAIVAVGELAGRTDMSDESQPPEEP